MPFFFQPARVDIDAIVKREFIMLSRYFTLVLLFTYCGHELTVANSSNDINEPTCPVSCSCSPDLEGPVLTVNCTGRTDNNSSLLVAEFNRLFVGDLLLKLTDLSITNSHLTTIPTSICQMTQLTRLTLNNNQLSQLPQHCFTRMQKLNNFQANNNEIEEVQVLVRLFYLGCGICK